MFNITDGRNETVDSVKAFISETGYNFPVYFDTGLEATDAYQARAIPMTVLVGANGAMISSHVGSMDAATLEAYIAMLLD